MTFSTMHPLFSLLPPLLRAQLCILPLEVQSSLCEIRLRGGAPIFLKTAKACGFLKEGALAPSPKDAFVVSPRLLKDAFFSLCRDSVQQVEEELRQGFFTVAGGHRIGVYGALLVQNGEVRGISAPSSLVIRLAHEVCGAASAILHRCYAGTLSSVLLYGPPGSGKTTLLRDLAAQLSAGCGGQPVQVAVLDERGELAALQEGKPRFSLGPCTDVYALCPKGIALEMALRAGAPELLVCDEIGAAEEEEALLLSGMAAGVAVAASAHAASFDGLLKRPLLHRLWEARIFDYYLLLEQGRVREIRQAEGRVIP